MRLQLILSSIEPSIMTIDNKDSFVYDNNKKINVKIDFQDKFFVTVNTINDNSPLQNSFIVKFEYKGNKLTSNGKVNIIKHSNYIYELVFINSQSLDISSQMFNHPSNNQLIVLENFNFKILDKNKIILNVKLKNIYPNASIESLKNNLLIKSHQNTKYNLCIIDQDNKTYEFNKCNYEIKENEIKIATSLNDYAKHIKIKVYTLNPFKLKESYTAYPKTPKKFKNKNVIPYAFLINILAGDYKEASSYLDENLKKSLKKEHLRLFFGDFVQISVPKTLNANNEVTLIYHENNNYYSTKTYCFDITDNKITNIDEKK